MKSRALKIAVVGTVIAYMFGCASAQLRLSRVPVDLSKYEVVGEATQSSMGLILFFCIPIGMADREAKIKNSLLKKFNADDLADPVISSKYFWTPIGTFHSITIKAKLVKAK